MNEKLKNHILKTLEEYENDKLTDIEYFENDEIIYKIVDSEIKFLQLLDDNQADAFREYSRYLLIYDNAMKAEYFSAGFVHGLYEEKSEFEL